MSSDPTPIAAQQRQKSLARQQEELVAVILEILGLRPPQELGAPERISPTEYDSIRAAVAHYTVTVCMEHGAIS
jgi:hypothetical protein